jgi:hypothetical protein
MQIATRIAQRNEEFPMNISFCRLTTTSMLVIAPVACATAAVGWDGSRVSSPAAQHARAGVSTTNSGALMAFYVAPASANVTLPDAGTDAGLLARLLIAESLNPGYSSYDEAEVQKGMKAMKAVVDNRLHYSNPGIFGAAGAKSYLDIVTAPGQYNGFTKDAGGKLAVSKGVRDVIDGVMSKANAGAPGAYAKFVQNALDVANGAVDDPFKGLTTIGGKAVYGGTYGWRKSGRGDPGGTQIKIPKESGGLIAGNQFYALLKNN